MNCKLPKEPLVMTCYACLRPFIYDKNLSCIFCPSCSKSLEDLKKSNKKNDIG